MTYEYFFATIQIASAIAIPFAAFVMVTAFKLWLYERIKNKMDQLEKEKIENAKWCFDKCKVAFVGIDKQQLWSLVFVSKKTGHEMNLRIKPAVFLKSVDEIKNQIEECILVDGVYKAEARND